MKSHLRNITVDGYAFVYWYTGGSRFILNLSPKENKNIKITLIFKAAPPEEEPHTSWSFYDISAQNNGMDVVIHLGKPKHIAEIISYLMANRPKLWIQGKPQVLDHAWDLLKEMGYSKFNPIWIRQW
ncbi:hypothetical protein [Paenibacillus jamilae]|uniref:hypothetical protein n=1 Tax=Paenibacillus jamilae TaxID=114136 RepID=UPI0007AB88B6|nr:hypothetical protein [Paenibacillus jamilae]KZE71238.1 hypothetical protein AV545_18710 [Paenibacillus jamilae]NEU26733.1 hypothetical protein [Paenibacillus polymyxa]